jgi:hypothetical protein
MFQSAQIVLHIKREMSLHLDYCASFGLSKKEMEASSETIGKNLAFVLSAIGISFLILLFSCAACTAYSRYILDVGQSEDWLALQMALAPCLIGYGAIARRLHSDGNTLRDGNKYWKWIENYVADDYTEAVRLGSGKKFCIQSMGNRLNNARFLGSFAGRPRAKGVAQSPGGVNPDFHPGYRAGNQFLGYGAERPKEVNGLDSRLKLSNQHRYFLRFFLSARNFFSTFLLSGYPAFARS